ncbi:MAG: Phage-related minor tail protein [Pelotomaculum sp. PtaB.Bin104]|nr:MAG: Phage-related minor tail protein [Pelotomaculum sp. PtaB.Bin104]
MPENVYISQIMASLGLDFRPAITAAEALEREAATLNTTLKNVEGQFLTASQSANMFAASVGKVAQMQAQTMQQLAVQSRTYSADIQRQATNVKGFIDRVFSANSFAHHANFFLTGGLLYGGFDVLNQGLVQVEKGMAGVAQVLPVLEQDQTKLNAASRDFLDIMQRYGASVTEVTDAAKLWGRAYKDLATVETLVNSTTLLSIVDNLNLTEATRGLEAAMNQYGMTAKNASEATAYSMKIVDSWSSVAHNAQVSAQDLAAATERTGAVAKMVGVDFDSLQGLIAASVRSTGLAGANLGNMWKSVFGSIHSDKAVEGIESLGVKMKEVGEDGQETWRPVIDVLLDIATKTYKAKDAMKELDEETLKAMAGGKFQWAKLGAALGDPETIIKGIALSVESQGKTLEYAKIQMDTISMKAKQLKATLIDLFSSTGDSGLRDTIKALLDTLNQFILGLSHVGPELVKVTGGFVGLMLTAKAVGGVYNTLLPVVTALSARNTALAVTVTAVTTAEIAEAGAANVAAAAQARLAATTALATAGVSLLLGALAMYVYKAGEGEKSQLELSKAFQDDIAIGQQKISQYQQEADYLTQMSGYHKNLQQQIESGTLTEEQADKVKKTLTATEEGLKIVIGEEAMERLKAAGFTEDAINQEKGAFNSKMEAERIAVQNTINAQTQQTQATIDGALERIQTLKAEGAAIKGLLSLEQTAASIGTGTYSKSAGLYEGLATGAEKLGLNWIAERYRAAAEINRQAAEERMQIFQDEVNNETAYQISQQERIIADAEANLGRLRGSVISTTPTSQGLENAVNGVGDEAKKTGNSLRDFAAQYQDFADIATHSLDQYNNVIQQTDNLLSRTNTKQQIIDLELQNATVPTLDQVVRQQGLYIQSIQLSAEKQNQLHTAAEAGRAQLANLNAVVADLNQQYESGTISQEQYNAAMEKISPAIQQLSQDVGNYSNTWWDAELSIKQAMQSISKTHDDYLQKAFDDATKLMQYEVEMGRMSTEQQIAYLNDLTNAKIWSVEQQRELEKERKQTYLEGLKEEMDSVKDAYDTRLKEIEAEIEAENKATETLKKNKQAEIDAIEESTNAQIDAIQALIDALDTEQETSDRKDAEREHNQKMADLQEQYNYESVRTGLEHQDKMADLQKQMADEEYAWQQKKEKWARDDQKKIYQDQIDALKKQADTRKTAIQAEIDDLEAASEEKKQKLQDYYNEVQKLLSDKNLEMLASLATTDEQYYDRGINLIKSLVKGIKDGSLDLEDAMSGIKNLVGDATSASKAASASSAANKAATTQHSYYYNYRSLIDEIIYLKSQWDSANKAGNQALMDSAASQAVQYYNKLPADIANILHNLNYNEAKIWRQQAVYHGGGAIYGSGDIPIIAQGGEYVLNANTVSGLGGFAGVERLVAAINTPKLSAVAASNAGGFSDAQIDRLIAAMEKRKGIQINTLFNAEKVGFEDTADMDILSRRMARSINSLSTAKGR